MKPKFKKETDIAVPNVKSGSQLDNLFLPLAQVMPIGYIVWDTEFRVLHWNPAAETIFGYSEIEALGKSGYELIVPLAIQAQVDSIWSWLLVGDAIAPNIKQNLTKDGNLILCDWFNTPIKTADGTVVVVSLVQDITERIKATLVATQTQEALRESEERYRRIVETAAEGIWTIDAQNRTTFVNHRMVEMLGYTESEMLGKSLFEFMDEEGKAMAAQKVARRQQNIEQQDDFKFRCKDGRDLWTIVSTTPICDRHGQYAGALGMITDITARKQAEEALRQTSLALENAVEGISRLDAKGRYLTVNKAYANMLGYAPEEMIGSQWNLTVHPEDRDEVERAYQTMLVDGKVEVEARGIRKDGSMFYKSLVMICAYDRQNNFSGHHCFMKDITEKKKLELQFLRAQRLESIGTLASGIAHDLNNILTPILASVQLLKKFVPDARSQQLLTTLETSAKRGANLVKQVLSFSRGIESDRAPMQISHLIGEIVKIIRETFPKSIEVSTDISPNLWLIKADATQLHQVLMNLVVNARDAMPEGGLLNISASNIEIDENYIRMNKEAKIGNYIIITVSDTGIGIEPKILERIFEPFFTTKEAGKGTGLGLATVQGIIKNHNGFINVTSQPRNTEFQLFLPAIPTENHQSSPANLEEILPGKGEWILVADDEAAIREITRTSLETYGYNVVTASDGIEAIALYAQDKERIKLAIVDLMMPSMDGIKTIQTLKKINAKLKIVAVSGLELSQQKSKLINLGAEIFLAKPYTTATLLKVLREVLDRSDRCI